jgi:deferrochelatase/peroxidase EfeB
MTAPGQAQGVYGYNDAGQRTALTRGSEVVTIGYDQVGRQSTDAAGHEDVGLLFGCHQRDVERGFAAIQRRLDGEVLQKYVLPFGGGYYLTLPGGALGEALLAP